VARALVNLLMTGQRLLRLSWDQGLLVLALCRRIDTGSAWRLIDVKVAEHGAAFS